MKNMIEMLFGLLLELSEEIWQLGVFLSSIFLLLAIYAMQSAGKSEAVYNAGFILSQFRIFAWLPYLWMGMCLLLAGCFGLKAFQGYRNHQQF